MILVKFDWLDVATKTSNMGDWPNFSGNLYNKGKKGDSKW